MYAAIKYLKNKPKSATANCRYTPQNGALALGKTRRLLCDKYLDTLFIVSESKFCTGRSALHTGTAGEYAGVE
jgi:hypothetical protein